jgi:hypothetical protein
MPRLSRLLPLRQLRNCIASRTRTCDKREKRRRRSSSSSRIPPAACDAFNNRRTNGNDQIEYSNGTRPNAQWNRRRVMKFHIRVSIRPTKLAGRSVDMQRTVRGYVRGFQRNRWWLQWNGAGENDQVNANLIAVVDAVRRRTREA